MMINDMFSKETLEVTDLVFKPGYIHLVDEDIWLAIYSTEMFIDDENMAYIEASDILTGKFYNLSISDKVDEFISMNGDKTNYLKWIAKNLYQVKRRR